MTKLVYIGNFSRVSVGDTGEILAKNKRLGGRPIQVTDKLADHLLKSGDWELEGDQDTAEPAETTTETEE